MAEYLESLIKTYLNLKLYFISLHTLYKKYKSSNFNEEYGNKYKKYRNTLVTVIKNAKRLYYCNSFNYNKNDMRKTWETINELIGKK